MDEIIRAVTKDGFVKISSINGKGLVEHARQIHNLSPVCTAALGRTLCATSILGDLLKEDDASVTIRINGGGPIGSVVAVSDCHGNVRGYVDNPHLDLPLREDGKLDVGGAVGTVGTITVSRDIGLKEPYIGSTGLISGEIADDLTLYFVESEQVPSACGLGVLVDTDLSVSCAGGYLIQLLPGAPDELINEIEKNILNMGSVSSVLADGTAEDLINLTLKGLNPTILDRTPVEYRCYCSREKVSRALSSLSKSDLDEIFKKGEEIEVSCHFCNTFYKFSPKDIQEYIDKHVKNSQV